MSSWILDSNRPYLLVLDAPSSHQANHQTALAANVRADLTAAVSGMEYCRMMPCLLRVFTVVEGGLLVSFRG